MDAMSRLTKAVLEWGDPEYLSSVPESFKEFKSYMRQEGLDDSDESAKNLLAVMAEKYRVHIDHYWLLTDLMLDFKTTSQLYFLNGEMTKKPDSSGRMLDKTSHLRVYFILAVVSYSKLKELIASYGQEKQSWNLPELDKELNHLMGLINRSSIIRYRSSYIAHAFAKVKGKETIGLHYRAGVDHVKKILATFNNKEVGQLNLDEDVDLFFKRIHDESNESSVVNLIHKFKEQIRAVSLHGYEVRR